MRKILVLQHVGHEPLGILDPMLKAAGFRIRYINFGRDGDVRPQIEGYNGLVILGGPMGVSDTYKFPHLLVEQRLIHDAIRAQIPVLGICLGAQLIASVLGAHVSRMPSPEFGWYQVDLLPSAKVDGLMRSWGEREWVFQAHQDQFDLPVGARHLVATESCPGQLFAFNQNVFGLQFHLEADQKMIHRWLKIGHNRSWIEHPAGRISEATILAETEKNMARSLELGKLTFESFIDCFHLPARPLLLGSGHGKPKRGGL